MTKPALCANTLDQQNALDTALRKTLRCSREDLAILLLETGYEILKQDDFDEIVHGATEAGYYHVVEFMNQVLPAFGAKSDDSTTVNTAISKGQILVIEEFIEENKLPENSVATAALFGQTDVVSLCLENGLDIEEEGLFGSPLRAASLTGHFSTVQMLLQRGASINACGSFGDALQAAATRGHLQIVDILIKNQVDVNNLGGFYGTALQAAAYKGHRNVAEALITAGAQIRMRGRTQDAFHAAAEAGREEIVSLFLEHGYQLPWRVLIYQHICSMGMDSSYKNLFVKEYPSRGEYKSHGISKDPVETQPLVPAAGLGDIFQKSHGLVMSHAEEYEPYKPLEADEDDQYQDRSYYRERCVLEAAVARGKEGVVKIILENRKTLGIGEYEIGRALLAASKGGHIGIVEALTSEGVDLLPFIERALERAAWHGHLAIIELLLDYESIWGPISTNIQERRTTVGPTPSYWPEKASHTDCERYCALTNSCAEKVVNAILLGGCHGEHPSVVERAFQTVDGTELQSLHRIALKEAAKSDNTHVIDFMLGIKDSWDPRSPNLLLDAFLIASEHGRLPILERLIESDGGERLQHCHYNIALKMSISKGHDDVAQYLLEKRPIETIGGTNEKTSVAIKGLSKDASEIIDGATEGIPVATGELLEDNSEEFSEDASETTDGITEDIPVTKEDLFEDASKNGCLRALKSLAPELRDGDLYFDTLNRALDAACDAGKRDVVEFLIRDGANVNALLEKEVVPQNQHQNLLLWESPPEPLPVFPRTPLEACLQKISDKGLDGDDAFREQETVIHFLLENGADVNPRVDCKTYPLHLAAAKCSDEVVRAVIRCGADINVTDLEFKTPLQVAAGREINSLPIVHVLLEAGAKVSPEILDAALYYFDNENGRFEKSKSIKEVLESGPGAVIKLLMTLDPEIKADERFSLLLHMTVVVGDRDFTRLLIERHVNVNICGHHHGTALQAAVQLGQDDCLNILLDAGADVNLVGRAEGPPVRAAIRTGNEEAVRTLISHGADVNLRPESTKFFNTRESSIPVVMMAVEAKNVALLQLLLDSEANIDETFPDKDHALLAACEEGNIDIVKLLLSRGADVNVPGKGSSHFNLIGRSKCASPLHRACAYDHLEIVRLLLGAGADLDKCDEQNFQSPLAVAAREGNLQVVQELVKAGATIFDPPRVTNALKTAVEGRNSDYFPLWRVAAIGRNHKKICDFLIQSLPEPKVEPACKEALAVANDCGDNIVNILFNFVPNTTDSLLQACKIGSKYTLEMILEEVDVNSDLVDGGRALQVAAYHQKVALIPTLIRKGADLCHVSAKYGSPIYSALEGHLKNDLVSAVFSTKGREFYRSLQTVEGYTGYYSPAKPPLSPKEKFTCEEIVKILVENGAQTNVGMSTFGNSLHLASFMGDLPLVQLLLRNGADINSTGGYFGSALIAAMHGDNERLATFLIDCGIDINYVSPEHESALQYACRHKGKRMVQILLANGADKDIKGTRGSPLAELILESRTYIRDEKQDKIDLLLQCRAGFYVTPKGLQQAVAGGVEPEKIQSLLEMDKDIQVTHDVIVAAAENSSFTCEKLAKVLLAQATDLEITPDILKAVRRQETLRPFLQYPRRCAFSHEILEHHIQKHSFSASMLQIVLEFEPHFVPQPGVVTALLLSNSYYVTVIEVLQEVFERNPEIVVTEAMFMAVEIREVLRVLLERRQVPVEVVESVVAEAENHRIQDVLFKRYEELGLGLGALEACRKGSDGSAGIFGRS